ncbi:MAG: VCBS repeat-containing protein [Gemmataceae bacterium]
MARIALLLGVWLAAGCSKAPDPPPPAPVEPVADPADIEQQIHNFCGGSCHAYPPADTFPREHWRSEVERGFKFFERSGMALKPPPFEAVVRHYEKLSPEKLAHAEIIPATHPLPAKFERISYPNTPNAIKPAISHVNVVQLGGGLPSLLACDMQSGRVLLMKPSDPKPEWRVLAQLKNPSHAEVVDLDRDGVPDILVADLGSFPPTDRLCGSVTWLKGKPDGTFTPITLLEGVGRVADVRAGEFFGSGKSDLVVAVFGLLDSGEILLLENRTTDWNKPEFVKKKIDSRHGAIHVPVADLNGDGKPDFVALIAQEHETIVAFLNTGGGTFQKKTLYNAPHPGWGSSGIQLTDLNADGRLDVLYTNGDILDEPYLLKPYHGISWLENTGEMKFAHHPIAAMYGAHNAVAADFFGTGRPGVAAVSFLPADKFPDRIPRKVDAVILLEQVSPGKFERHSLATLDCDAVVCAAGDLYGTGRPALAAGNFSATSSTDPVVIWKNLGK